MKAFRSVLAVIVAVLVLIGVAGLMAVDAKHPAKADIAVPAPVITTAPGASSVICPRGVVQPSEVDAKTAMFDPSHDGLVGASTIEALAHGGTGAKDMTANFGPLGAPNVLLKPQVNTHIATIEKTSPSSATILSAQTSGSGSVLTAGSATVTGSTGSMSGLSTMACQPSSSSSFIIGGSGKVGSSAILMIANPSQSSVSVDVTLWGSSGVINAPQLIGLVLPGQSQRAVRLDGLAIGSANLAVEVSSDNGQVSTWLQDSRSSNGAALGMDFAVPGAAPATEQLVPGVIVGNGSTSVIRVLAPTATAATVAVTLWGADGSHTPATASQVNIKGGAVSDISLEGLPDGTYTADVASNVPIITAAYTYVGGAHGDISWSAGRAAASRGLMAIPGNVTGFTIGSGKKVHATIQAISAGGQLGKEVGIGVGANTTVSTPLSTITRGMSGAVAFLYTLTGDGANDAAFALTSSSGEGISVSVPASEARSQEMSITVHRAGL